MYALEALVMTEPAKARWRGLTPAERAAVEQSFLSLLDKPGEMILVRLVEVTRRYDQGFRTYNATLIESPECFLALGSYEGSKPFVLDIVIKGDVCLLSH